MVIKTTAALSDPFVFNAAAMVVQTVALVVFLTAAAIKTSHPQRSDYRFGLPLLGVAAAVMPMLWLVVSRMEYAFFAWSLSFVDAAVTAALFRLWPLVMVLLLARYAARLRRAGVSGVGTQRRISGRQGVLMVLAIPTAAVVTISQIDKGTPADGGWGLAMWGGGLALAGAVLAGISPAVSLMLGDQLQRLRGSKNGEVKVWQHVCDSVAAQACSSAAAVPLCAALAAFTAETPGLNTRAIIGAGATGVLSATAIIGVRAANVYSNELKINAMFQMITPLSLAGLAATGIDIPNMRLFVMGTVAMLLLTAAVEFSGRSSASRLPGKRT